MYTPKQNVIAKITSFVFAQNVLKNYNLAWQATACLNLFLQMTLFLVEFITSEPIFQASSPGLNPAKDMYW